MSQPDPRRGLLWIVTTAFFTEQLDSTVVNTAVPAIAASLQVATLRSLRGSTIVRGMQSPLSYRHRLITEDDLVFIRRLVAVGTLSGHRGCCASCQVPVLRLPGWRTTSTLIPWVVSVPQTPPLRR